MANTALNTTRGRRDIALVALGAAVLAVATGLVLAFAGGTADGKNAQIIGAKKAPKPLCEKGKKDACLVMGHTTGYMVSERGKKPVSKVKKDGHIVAWSVALGTPDADERSVYEEVLPDATFDRYGSDPVAGLSILKGQGKGKFKLAKSTPIVELDPVLGESPIFTLKKPIKVKKGTVVALTTPTWLPNYAAPEPNDTAWRASRKPERCSGEDLNGDGEIDPTSEEAYNLTKRSKPHTKKGTTKKYGCTYRREQILYWAYFVPSGKKKGGKNNK